MPPVPELRSSLFPNRRSNFPILLRLPRVAWVSGITHSMMRIGMQPKHGDIVLIPIPFTDLSSQKQRPVIVISNDDYNHTTPDFVVVAMTSNPTLSPYSFTI